VEVKNFNLIIENTKNFQWYFKWLNSKKIVNVTRTYWSYKIEDLKSGLDSEKVKMINQHNFATTADLNAIRYESDIQYDCSKGIWNKIVSVPFLNPNGDIRFSLSYFIFEYHYKNFTYIKIHRGVVSISISLNKFDLKQCGASTLPNISYTEYNAEGINSISDFSQTSLVNLERDPFYNTDRCDRITTDVMGLF
jgi:hypothetical protein